MEREKNLEGTVPKLRLILRSSVVTRPDGACTSDMSRALAYIRKRAREQESRQADVDCLATGKGGEESHCENKRRKPAVRLHKKTAAKRPATENVKNDNPDEDRRKRLRKKTKAEA